MLESMKAVAAIQVPPRYQPHSLRDEMLRFARTCYDHLAGRAGVSRSPMPWPARATSLSAMMAAK
jgi:hypothetical protein